VTGNCDTDVSKKVHKEVKKLFKDGKLNYNLDLNVHYKEDVLN